MTAAFTHLNANGEARMVDVGAKPLSRRTAMARGEVVIDPNVISLIRDGRVPKGDVLAAARVAAIMAAKQVDRLIPLCHSVALDAADVSFDVQCDRVIIRAEVSCVGRTGVEMEALTAVSVAALTLYDMCKALDRAMVIGSIVLERKTGGRSGDYVRQERP